MILGQEQDAVGNGFERQQSLSGSLSELHLWNRILEEDEIHAMANCTSTMFGDVINWENSQWKMENVEVSTINVSVLCIRLPQGNAIMFPERRSLSAGVALCRSVGGKVVVPQTELGNMEFVALSEDYVVPCEVAKQSGKTFWIGVEPSDATRTWQDMETKESLTYSNWRLGYEAEGRNCAFVFTGDYEEQPGTWGVEQCSQQSPSSATGYPESGGPLGSTSNRRFCTLCEFPEAITLFSVRGLCKQSRHDRKLILQRTRNGKPIFKGNSSSILTWDDSNDLWILDHLRYRANATYRDYTKLDYPIGRRKWQVFDRLCGSFEGKEKFLTITKCRENEFTCDDGSCQPLEHRCDLKGDCADRSDEEGCRKVVLSEDYDKNLNPKFTDENGTRLADVPLPVWLGIDIINFDAIDTVNMMYSVMLRLNLTWNDRRLKFLNLRDNNLQNTIPEQVATENIWIPKIGFDNAKTGPLAKDDYFVVMIRKDSKPEPFDNSRHKEDAVYEGWKNKLIFTRRYYAEYHCHFNLKYYPFDSQKCRMVFKMRTATKEYVVLKDGGLRYKGQVSMVEFTLADLIMKSGDSSTARSVLIVEFIFKREYAYQLITSFFQSFLLGLIAHLTFYIDVEDFTDRFMGTLTSLLVLASLMSGINVSLPKTSYFKMIDVWLVFFLVSTSLNVAAHIAIDRLLRREKSTTVVNSLGKSSSPVMTARRLNNFMKVAFPICFVLFTLAFAITAAVVPEINNEMSHEGSFVG